MCLVLSCWTGLCAMLIAALLSQYNFITPSIGCLTSSRTRFSHNISQIPCDIALNSASALLLATTPLFLTPPCNQMTPNKCAITRGGPLISNWTSPISVSIGFNTTMFILPEKYSLSWCALKVSLNSVDHFKVLFIWRVHELTHHTHCKSYIWPSMRQVD